MPIETHTVTLRLPDDREVRLAVASDQTVLDAALRAGIDLPNTCCQGWCITCAARLVSGRVEHPHALRYYPQDAEGGYVLLCTAQPRSDCLIVTHQKQALKAWRDRHNLPAPAG